MGGAPPPPLDFAPQGQIGVTFFAPSQGAEKVAPMQPRGSNPEGVRGASRPLPRGLERLTQGVERHDPSLPWSASLTIVRQGR